MKFSIDRDTPHHLKNKRVQQGAIDKAAANILLASAPRQLETLPQNTSIDANVPDIHRKTPEPLNESGKLAQNN